VLLLACCFYLVSPYLTLWRLNRTVVDGPTAALAPLVELESVRDQLQRRLNKEQESCIGEVSDAFIDWIQDNIRRYRSEPLAKAIDLTWLRELLLTHSRDNAGFWPALDYAFYASPTRFLVRIDAPANADEADADSAMPPVHLHLRRDWFGWRVSAAYY
jgi:hypothetical protein